MVFGPQRPTAYIWFMPSILPGFEYDIFISYRHNDNLDGWVTDFVQNLEKELKGTLKDSVTIYFDKNPHDGLLETHLVDKSLEGKLKCLIFIPIISQTYCDSKSFAWQHEFLAFNKLAKADEFGTDIKLKGGNVASRILPIKIHDIDVEDKALFEEELGGVLRAIEFIFKSPGVNRPLGVHEDRPNDNVNRTHYKDQINKVANAVKDVINGLRSPGAKATTARIENHQPFKQKVDRKAAVLIVLILVMLGMATYYLLQKRGDRQEDKISIAIIPFHNQTSNKELDGYSFGIASEIRTQLSLSKNFDFITADQATLRYLDTNKTPVEIANELGVDYLLFGSFYQLQDKLKITAELADGRTNKSLWSLPAYETSVANVQELFNVQASISQKVLDWFSILGKIEANSPTKNHLAYELYLKGREASRKNDPESALALFSKAVALDSNFLSVQVALFDAMVFKVWDGGYDIKVRKEFKPYLDRIERMSPDSWETNYSRGQYYYHGLKDYDQGLEFLKRTIEMNPGAIDAYDLLSVINRRKLQYEEALRYRLKAIELDPQSAASYFELSRLFLGGGKLKEAFRSILTASELGLQKSRVSYWVSLLAADSNAMNIVPPEIRAYNTGNYYSLLTESNRDWKGMIQVSDTATFYDINVFQSIINKAYAYRELFQTDSARYYAKRVIEKCRGSIDEVPITSFMKVILGKPDEAIRYYSEDIELWLPSHNGTNLVRICQYELDKVILLAYAGKYQDATNSLIDMNRNYPKWVYYRSLWRDFRLDKIKREYPPFQNALKNLVLPAKLEIHGILPAVSN